MMVRFSRWFADKLDIFGPALLMGCLIGLGILVAFAVTPDPVVDFDQQKTIATQTIDSMAKEMAGPEGQISSLTVVLVNNDHRWDGRWIETKSGVVSSCSYSIAFLEGTETYINEYPECKPVTK